MLHKTLLIAFGLISACLGYSQKIQLIPATPTVPWLIGAEHANDARLFLIRQDGYIMIRKPDGTVLPTPFLDCSSKVKLEGEQGLLGLAFHPNYAANGQFFVYYSAAGTGASVLSRFFRSSSNPDQADPASEVILLTFPHPIPGHVGGSLKFGPDGYLYLSSGDGGEFTGPNGGGQDNHLFLGKILRVDVDGASPYAIPADNPFVGNPDYLPEIWCTGLRNPWRMSFDRLTGDTWIGDVGEFNREEIDFLPKGAGGKNFGWPCKEGTMDFNPCSDSILCCLTLPLFEYAHNTHPSCSGSIIGGTVYRGYRWNDLWGRYIFADYCTGEIWALDRQDTTVQVASLGVFSPFEYASIAEGVDGELYAAGSYSPNKLYRIESLNCAPVARIVSTLDAYFRCASNTELMSLSAYSSNTSGMNFQWQKNGVNLPNETNGTYSFSELKEDAQFRVVVTNPANGCSATSNPIGFHILPDVETTIDTILVSGQMFLGTIMQHDTVFSTQATSSGGCVYRITYHIYVQSDVGNHFCWVTPNPAHSDADLHFKLENFEPETKVQIYNALGQLLHTFHLTNLPMGLSHNVLPVSELPYGVYSLHVQTGHKNSTIQFLHL